MKKITADLILNISHVINDVNFQGGNGYNVIDKGQSYKKIIRTLETEHDTPETKIKEIFEVEAQIASLALSKDEYNPYYGCGYFTVDWENHSEEQLPDVVIDNHNQKMTIHEHLGIRDSLRIISTRSIQLDLINEFFQKKDKYSYLIENFYNGLKSNNHKSKFFNFFIIIEHCESTKEYRSLFADKFLFSEDEKRRITQLAEQFEQRKNAVILESLKRTELNRSKKLYQYLQTLDLPCFASDLIQLNDIDELITQRNKLFHSSSEFDETLLYKKLFPLVKDIILKKYL